MIRRTGRGWRVELVSVCGLLALALGMPGGARAAPPALPSSFWGNVTLADGRDAPVGAVVRALVDGQARAEALTREFEGRTVYSLHVPGSAGEAVGWELCDVPLPVHSAWQGGSNARVDLQAPPGADCQEPAAATVAPPQAASVVRGPAPSAAEARPPLPSAKPSPDGQEGSAAAPLSRAEQWVLAGSILTACVLALAGRRAMRRA
jgi:hypothetical protein